jgi:hypothetical protein
VSFSQSCDNPLSNALVPILVRRIDQIKDAATLEFGPGLRVRTLYHST